ncbi:type IV toxin-antitoxin system AbiEi family antitoxin domain-containing protein [Gracilinema caldarium]|uniref:Transcriptional regulator, AbiEi antitoxin, Type IV TA system n=1 Tax=Gracilinema caldarium (strain ATCC 51460 / DSM 7334 / H1) TaxID=744872 RepID=F8EZQ3_GRAC1|nr:hypothetical protein [Gracilinema caldarium]AEJ20777.1 hypothetical protein Spica_2680 [Gracilinema caldarium DSM 7334]
MILNSLSVMDSLKKYASPKARLTRLLKTGKLIQIRRGLYVDERTISPRVLAPLIYGPSYISFQYALAFHGLIPEKVEIVTSASFNKNKNKIYRTPLGEYRYYYVPTTVYSYGISLIDENGYTFLLASAEKALCDALYRITSITKVSDLETVLFEDWRMEPEDIESLDTDFIMMITPRYGRRSLLFFREWFQKRGTQ